MKYFIANFTKYIPQIEGLKNLASYDHYSIFSITDDAMLQNPFAGVSHEEITELEGTVAWKFYGEVRGYRKAYSDVEGLEPDAEELAKGKRKTKITMTDEITEAVVVLMKRIFRLNVIDEYNKRDSRDGEELILTKINTLNTIREIAAAKEKLLGVGMTKTQLLELGLWDSEKNSRIDTTDYSLGF